MMVVKVIHSHEAPTPCEALVAWMSCDRCAVAILDELLDNLSETV